MPAVHNVIELVGLLIWVVAPIVGTVWVARVSAQTREHEARIAELETMVSTVRVERDELRHLFRVAVHHIRDWLEWARQHPLGTPPPDLPAELRDEV